MKARSLVVCLGLAAGAAPAAADPKLGKDAYRYAAEFQKAFSVNADGVPGPVDIS